MTPDIIQINNLQEYLITNPTATYLVRVKGDSMKDSGILSGDILIIDRSIPMQNDSVIVAILNNNFTIRRLIKREGRTYLLPDNDDYEIIDVTDNPEYEEWGTVTYAIR